MDFPRGPGSLQSSGPALSLYRLSVQKRGVHRKTSRKRSIDGVGVDSRLRQGLFQGGDTLEKLEVVDGRIGVLGNAGKLVLEGGVLRLHLLEGGLEEVDLVLEGFDFLRALLQIGLEAFVVLDDDVQEGVDLQGVVAGLRSREFLVIDLVGVQTQLDVHVFFAFFSLAIISPEDRRKKQKRTGFWMGDGIGQWEKEGEARHENCLLP